MLEWKPSSVRQARINCVMSCDEVELGWQRRGPGFQGKNRFSRKPEGLTMRIFGLLRRSRPRTGHARERSSAKLLLNHA